MFEEFFVKEMPNGMTLLAERMEHVSSAAMTLLVPAGASHDPADAAGSAAVVSEWCFRGAGERDTRQLNNALDVMGCQHSETVTSEHIQLAAAQLGKNLDDVLAIYADILIRPRLEDVTFKPCRELVLQDLAALEDEPAKKCTIMLRERFYPYPLGRCIYGQADSLQAMTPETVRKHTGRHFTPKGTVLSVAGNIDWERFFELAEKHFGGFSAKGAEPVKTEPASCDVTHIKKDSAQAHIVIAHNSVTASDSRYYAARMAETVLSGGMSGRLFTEVREKRGLVYHVSSRYHSLKDHAGMFTYAGTTPENAQETFDVTVGELRRLAEGIEPDEMARARTQLKSALVMQGESTSARANAMASDWYHLHRLRSLQELSQAIENVTVEEVLGYLKDCPAENLSVLLIGPEPLKTGEQESSEK